MRIVLDEDIATDCTLERVSDVVDEEVVTVSPTAHIKVLKRVHVIFPERFVPKEMACVAVVGKPKGVLEHEKSKRLLENWSLFR